MNRLVAAMRAGLRGRQPRGDGCRRGASAAHHRWFYECTPEIHAGLAEMYVADPRFTATYEKIAPGLAQYLRDAIVANGARAAG